MNSIGSKVWKAFSNGLLAAGMMGFMALFLWNLGLIGYYSFTRPYGPVPELGWTVPLRWTHGAYGTFKENAKVASIAFLGHAVRVSGRPWGRDSENPWEE